MLPVASETGVNLSETEHPVPLAQLTAILPPESGLLSVNSSSAVGDRTSVTVADSPLARLSMDAPLTIFNQFTSGTDTDTVPLSPLPSFTSVTSM